MKSSFYAAQASTELRAIFQELRELSEMPISKTDETQNRKYSDKVLYSVGQMVLFRSHGTQMNSLCILILAATQASGGRGYADFLWLGGAGKKNCCIEYFQRLLPDQSLPGATCAIATETGLEVYFAESDNKSIELKYEFIPLLAGFLEFILRSLGPAAIEGICENLASEKLTRNEMDALANTLTRDIYAWIDPHVESKHHQDEFKIMGDYFANRLGEDFVVEDIDDESIFVLWEFKSGLYDEQGKGMSTKKYGSTYIECMRFMDLMSGSVDLERLENTMSITSAVGDARTYGEVTMDAVSQLQSTPSELDDEAAISNLRLKITSGVMDFADVAVGESVETLYAVTRSDVNIVNSSDEKLLEEILLWERWLLMLPVSYLRHKSFGSIAKLGGKTWKDIFAENKYQTTISELRALEHHLNNALAGCFYLREDQHRPSDEPEVNNLAYMRGKKFLKKNRAGFKEALSGDALAMKAILDAEDGLIASKTGLSKLTQAIHDDFVRTSKYESDRDRFTGHFEMISRRAS